MNNRSRKLIRSLPVAIVAVLVLIAAPWSFAGSGAVPDMARILANLNHYPSAEQKEALAAISKDESNSDATRAIANAIHNIEHKITAEDAAALKAITESDAASDAEKKLASIALGINHFASEEDKKALEALAAPKE